MVDQACTLADVKAQLRITSAGDDAYITTLIQGVTDWMQSEAGANRKLTDQGAATILFDTAAGSAIDVSRYGIRSVTTLSIATSNQPDTGGTYTAVAASDIVLRPPAGDRLEGMPATSIVILGSSARLYDAINGASVQGSFGPSATPLRLARIACDAVCAAFQSRRAGASGVIGADQLSVPPWSAYFAWGSPQWRTLRAFRLTQGIA